MNKKQTPKQEKKESPKLTKTGKPFKQGVKRPRKDTSNIKNKPENFFKAIQLIEFEGLSLFKALSILELDTKSFYKWLDSDEINAKSYARACNKRSERIFEEMIEIADKQEKDVYIDKEGKERIDHNVIHRNKLQIDTRKWMLAKMNPKKYGDKIDVTTDGEKVNNVPQIVFTKPKDEH
jgi:hypothetical protein